MNTLKFARNGSIALIAFVLLALPVSSVRAADLGWDSYDVYDFGPSMDQSYDVYDYSIPEYDESYDVYDYSSPSYDVYDYSYPSYDYSGSSYPVSYYTGAGYAGGSYISGPSYIPSRPTTGGGTTVVTNNNTNNNNNVNNNVITVNTQTPVVYTTPITPTYNAPVCTLNASYNYSYGYQPVTLSWTSQYATSGFINNGVGSISTSGSVTVNPHYTTTYTATFYGQNGQSVNCSATVTRGVAYNTPYVALSAVPYTGLELGFWGTVAYYGFLVLWCLVAAYLIVVKKIQNRILNSLNAFLFGTSAEIGSQKSSEQAGQTFAHQISAPVAAAISVDAIDDFIMSQINKVGR